MKTPTENPDSGSAQLYFGLATLLGATWIFLLRHIVESTYLEPTQKNLIALSVIHYIVSIYFILSCTSMYYGGLRLSRILSARDEERFY